MSPALTKQAGMLTASRALGQILNALAGFLIVRALTQYDYGTYRQVLLLYTTLYLIGDLAFAQSLYFFVPREREKARVFLGQALVATLGLSALWSAGMLLLSGPISTFFGNPALAAHMALLSALLSLNLLTKIPEVGLVTLNRIGASSMNITVFETLKFVMVVAALKWHASIDSILAAMILATGLRMIALLVQMRDTAWFILTPRLSEQFRYSMALWLPGLLNNAGIYAHQYIVGFYFNPEQYAIYAVACFQIPLIGVITSSVNEIFLVRATEYYSQERFDDLYQLYQNACRKVLMILVPAAVALAALARPLIELLFTRRYLPSVPLFILMVMALPLGGMLQDGIFRASAAMRAYSLFYMMRVALALGLGVVGAKYFGLWGAALSPLLSLLTLNIAQLHKVRELLHVSFARVLPWKEIARILLASLAGALPAMAVARLFARSWMALGAGLAVFGIVYALLAVLLDVIHADERRAVLGTLRWFQPEQTAAKNNVAAPGSAVVERRPRVMLFTDSFVHGGTERQLVQALRLLDGEKYDVLVGCLKRRGPFLADVEAMGIPVHEFPITSLQRWHTIVWFDRLMKFFREEQIDVVHAFDYYTDLFAVPAAYFSDVPVVIASRRNLAHNRTALERWALRAACSLADCVVANSQAAALSHAGLLTSTRRKVEVIHNALEPAEYRFEHSAAELREKIGLPAGELLAGVVAALRPEKGHRTFLRAVAMVAREHPSAKYVLFGDGSERAALIALAAELGIAERVIFAGDRRDIPECLAALDLVVLPSDFESLPNAVLEAMAAGRPVVTTRVGGTPELVEDGVTGYLVPVGDSEAMARRMIELLHDPAKRRAMGEAGRARAEREFSTGRMRQKLEELYDRLLRGKKPVARVLQIGNFPPPVCGWSLHTQIVQQELDQRGADSRVMDIGPARAVEGRGCETVKSGFDYARKLLLYRLRGFTFHVHVNGDSWKGYALALAAVLLGWFTGKHAVLTFHAGPTQLYFPRARGFWHWAFRLLFAASAEVICNHEPVKQAIAAYGISPEKIHPIPAFSVQYTEELPVPLPATVEQFLRAHEPRLFSYSLFRVEFTMDALFEAFAAVRRDFPRAGMLIAGPQEVPPEATEQMRRLSLTDALLIPGNLPHAEFLTAVQRSDVFVRTHLRDGVCTSVLEALKLGVPVVASDDGIRPPSVITFAPGDAADLHRKLAAVLGDLAAMRAKVRSPELRNHLEEEISLLLAAGARASEARG